MALPVEVGANKMKKIYKMSRGYLRYHEASVTDCTITERWGLVGEYGEEREYRVSSKKSEKEHIANALCDAKKSGFRGIAPEDHAEIKIVYPVKQWIADNSIDDLGERINQQLRWTGLGHIKGVSQGIESITITCLVVDFEVGRQTLECYLEHSDFANYSRIFQSNFDERIEDGGEAETFTAETASTWIGEVLSATDGMSESWVALTAEEKADLFENWTDLISVQAYPVKAILATIFDKPALNQSWNKLSGRKLMMLHRVLDCLCNEFGNSEPFPEPAHYEKLLGHIKKIEEIADFAHRSILEDRNQAAKYFETFRSEYLDDEELKDLFGHANRDLISDKDLHRLMNLQSIHFWNRSNPDEIGFDFAICDSNQLLCVTIDAANLSVESVSWES